MNKKALIPLLSVAILLAGTSSQVIAKEPVYDQDGNLVLDLENEEYQDLTEGDVKEPVISSDTEENNNNKTLKPKNTEVQIQEEEEQSTEVTPPAEEPTVPPETEPVEPTEPPGEGSNEEDLNTGEMSPANSTYVADTTTPITSMGNKDIKEVTLDTTTKLPEGSWSFIGTNLTFNNNMLDTAVQGTYDFTITFVDDSTASYTLKIISVENTEDYWKQNTFLYSKDARSYQHKDLQLISNRKSITVTAITINGVTIPKDKYIITQGIITISKSYLATLKESPRSRITVNYNSTFADFELAIYDTIDDSTASEVVEC